jgi:MEDS: MEthanogen/methylotroph, DcmR Sensory domain
MSRVAPSRIELPQDFKGTRHPDLLSLHKAENPKHLVQFYEDDSILVENVAFLVKAALTNGDCAIVVATDQHRRAICDRLAQSGIDVESLSSIRQLVMLDAPETLSQLMIDNRPDPIRFDQVVGDVIRDAITRGASGFVFAFGEMVAVLCAEGNSEGAIQLEQLWNGLRTKYTFSLYCAYSFDCLRPSPFPEILLDICKEHSTAVP